MNDLALKKFAGARVLITGGLGFIGSNLAIALVGLGADVTIVDSMLLGYGGNLFNIDQIRNDVRVNYSDIRDVDAMNSVVKGQDYIFHLASQVDHVLSLSNPYPDIDINITGTTVIMEACKHQNPNARVIYTGTRGEYGPAVTLPVNENAPTCPRGIHEISRLTAESIVQVYHRVHQVRSVLLRLSNIYGPRAQVLHPRYGVANWFVGIAVQDETIHVFGDGQIKRDFLYVDDCVRAILLCAANDRAYGQVFNVGVDLPTNFMELAELVVRISGRGRWEFAPFSPERAAQEPGDFYSDITKIRTMIGWEPEVLLTDGLRRTIEYYRTYQHHYWRTGSHYVTEDN